MEKKPEKLMDVAKIGAKGQIVIPKSMRDMFGLRPGDTLLLLADGSRGIAMNKLDLITDAVEKAMMGEPTADDKRFAAAVKEALKNVPFAPPVYGFVVFTSPRVSFVFKNDKILKPTQAVDKLQQLSSRGRKLTGEQKSEILTRLRTISKKSGPAFAKQVKMRQGR